MPTQTGETFSIDRVSFKIFFYVRTIDVSLFTEESKTNRKNVDSVQFDSLCIRLDPIRPII